MNFKYTKLILLACSAFILVSCGPKKTEETPVPQPEQQKTKEGNLTPQQKEELEIDEDNVMNPFPG